MRYQENAKKLPVSLFIYMALDGDGQLMADVTRDQLSSVIGRSQSLGDFRLVFPKSSSKVWHNYLVSYTSSLDKIQETIMKAFHLFPSKNKNFVSGHYIGLPGKAMPEGISEARANLIVYQVSYCGCLGNSYCIDARLFTNFTNICVLECGNLNIVALCSVKCCQSVCRHIF